MPSPGLAIPLDASGEAFPQASPLAGPRLEGRALAADRLLDLLDGTDESQANLAFLAQLEAQGSLAPGTVDLLAAAHEAAVDMPPPGPPENVYRDAHPFCDTNGDGYGEVLMNDYSLLTFRPTLRMLDGRTGRSLWVESNTMWFSHNLIPPSFRAFDPDPLRSHEPRNVQGFFDLNSDGTCDFFAHTFQVTGNGPLLGRIQGFIRAHSGAGPFLNLWQYEYTGLIAVVADPAGLAQCIELQGFPTGFLATAVPDGARLAFKTTDLRRCDVVIPDPVGVIGDTQVSNVWVTDHLRLFSGTSNVPLWTRDLAFDLSANRTELRWMAGLGRFDDGPEPDIALDVLWISNPRSNRAEADNPLNGEPMTRNGRGMDLLALGGDDGSTLWRAVAWDDLAVRANPPTQEESFELLVGTTSYVLGDLDGDGRDEVMGQVLAREVADATSANGAFRTHFVPVDGATGALLWGDVKYQGWGHAQRIQGPDNATRVAVGTMDVPTPVPPQGRFPPKDLRVAVLDPADGTALWSHRAQYPQDSMIGYDLALQQYRLGLAPFDVDGDGWPDIVTPGQYVPPSGADQVLLSQARQRFEVLSGATGRTALAIDTFGSNGLLLPCGDDFVAFGGYGGHLEASRISTDGVAQWSELLYIDPTPTAATAGIDLTFLSARCAATGDNRTFAGVNAGVYSQKRGTEILNLYGYPHAEAVDTTGQDPVWMIPNHLAKRKLLERLAALLEEPAGPTASDRLVWAAVPSVPGLLLGAVAGVVANRKSPLPPRPAKVKLPDLYGGE